MPNTAIAKSKEVPCLVNKKENKKLAFLQYSLSWSSVRVLALTCFSRISHFLS